MVERDRRNYTKAIDSFQSFLDYQKTHKINLPEEVIEKVKVEKEECNELITKSIKDAGKKSKKNVPKSSDIDMGKKKVIRGKPYQRLKNIPKDRQKADMEELWAEMERNKMDIPEDSKWYIISANWFNEWKEW